MQIAPRFATSWPHIGCKTGPSLRLIKKIQRDLRPSAKNHITPSPTVAMAIDKGIQVYHSARAVFYRVPANPIDKPKKTNPMTSTTWFCWALLSAIFAAIDKLSRVLAPAIKR